MCSPFHYWCKKGRQTRKRQFYLVYKQKTHGINSIGNKVQMNENLRNSFPIEV